MFKGLQQIVIKSSLSAMSDSSLNSVDGTAMFYHLLLFCRAITYTVSCTCILCICIWSVLAAPVCCFLDLKYLREREKNIQLEVHVLSFVFELKIE